jgi:hypothetical protein
MYLVLTHLLAAVAAVALLWLLRGLRIVRHGKRLQREVWERQSVAAVQRIGVLEPGNVPPPFSAIEDTIALTATGKNLALFCKLGLFDYLEERPGAALGELCRHLDVSERQLEPRLEVLIAAGALVASGDGYALTQRARVYLLSTSPMFDWAMPRPDNVERMRKILKAGHAESVAGGWVQGRASAPQRWAAGMHRVSFPLGFALGDTGILDGRDRVMDVAGGAGSVCIALALRNPGLEAIVMELPGSVPTAERMIARYELSDRIACLGANMFEGAWPTELDAVLFTNVFHDWGDDKCRVLAEKAFASLRPAGVIVVQEALLHDDEPGPLWTASFSVSMTTHMQGRQFKGRALRAILESAGFETVEVRPLLGYFSAVVGRKRVE